MSNFSTPRARDYAHLQNVSAAAKGKKMDDDEDEDDDKKKKAKKADDDEGMDDDKTPPKDDKETNKKSKKSAKEDDDDGDDDNDDDKKKNKKASAKEDDGDDDEDDDEDDDDKKKKSKASASASDYRRGYRAATERCAAIFASPHAANNLAAAAKMAFETKMSASAAVDVLATCGPLTVSAKSSLRDAMATVKIPAVGQGGNSTQQASTADALADRIIKAGERARGVDRNAH